jgi:hypothetical protein
MLIVDVDVAVHLDLADDLPVAGLGAEGGHVGEGEGGLGGEPGEGEEGEETNEFFHLVVCWGEDSMLGIKVKIINKKQGSKKGRN